MSIKLWNKTQAAYGLQKAIEKMPTVTAADRMAKLGYIREYNKLREFYTSDIIVEKQNVVVLSQERNEEVWREKARLQQENLPCKQ